ncbi:MAG: SDR family oxidoreductase [Actinomycetota bacterium]|nr:SDR family oxidoreductase [Actinomycetota bacterium]
MSAAAAEPGRPSPAPVVSITAGDRVAVTGASGFIGSAITRRLLERGAIVVAVTEPAGEHRNLWGLDVEVQPADVRDPESVRRALGGSRFVFHTAALYGFWAKDPSAFSRVNVQGTRNVLEAASAEGVERIVYTSTVGTLGLESATRGVPATEEAVADVSHLFGHYKRSKYVAEHEVLRAAAEGVPVSLVLPTFPLGPGDRRPTPTGKVVVDFLNGRLPGYVDTAMNVVHVDDVAAGHLLALERGVPGRSYIMGGENVSMRELLMLLAEITGLRPARLRVPKALALAAGLVSETVEGRVLGREPSVPLEAARMSTTTMIFDDSRARRELGYSSRSARGAVEDSVRWFFDNGYARRRPVRAAPWAADLGRWSERWSKVHRSWPARYNSAQHVSQ